MSCTPPKREPGILLSLLEFEPFVKGYVISVPALFPACVLYCCHLFFCFCFFPNVCIFIKQATEETGWLGAVKATGFSVNVRLGLFWHYLFLSALLGFLWGKSMYYFAEWKRCSIRVCPLCRSHPMPLDIVPSSRTDPATSIWEQDGTGALGLIAATGMGARTPLPRAPITPTTWLQHPKSAGC